MTFYFLRLLSLAIHLFCFSQLCAQDKNHLVSPKALTSFVMPKEEKKVNSSIILKEIAKTHLYFAFYKTGPTEFLGNFAHCPNGIEYAGHHFQNSEAAFQWAKFQFFGLYDENKDLIRDPEMNQFFEATGEEAFRLRQKFTRKYPSRCLKAWQNGLRDLVMWQILKAKFQQNSDFANDLMATHPLYLLEHNEKEGRDIYWSDDATGNGLNMLGKMLMAIRDGTPCPLPNDNEDRLERTHYTRDFNRKKPYHIF